MTSLAKPPFAQSSPCWSVRELHSHHSLMVENLVVDHMELRVDLGIE